MNPTADTLINLARWLGESPLTLFFCLLLAGVLLVGGLAHGALRWLVLPPSTNGQGPATSPPASFVPLLVGYAAGLGLIVATGALFAEVAEALGDGVLLAQVDQAFSDAVRANTSATTLTVFSVLTHFGDTLTLSLLCVGVAGWLWWRRFRLMALGWVLAVAGNSLLNVALKAVFRRDRPAVPEALAAGQDRVLQGLHVVADGFSFPSGHSSGAMVAYGMLAYVVTSKLPARWHLPAWLLAAAIVLTTGSSRVFLQVHFASDVLAGFASGAAWLTVCVLSTSLARKLARRRLRRGQNTSRP